MQPWRFDRHREGGPAGFAAVTGGCGGELGRERQAGAIRGLERARYAGARTGGRGYGADDVALFRAVGGVQLEFAPADEDVDESLVEDHATQLFGEGVGDDGHLRGRRVHMDGAAYHDR